MFQSGYIEMCDKIVKIQLHMNSTFYHITPLSIPLVTVSLYIFLIFPLKEQSQK